MRIRLLVKTAYPSLSQNGTQAIKKNTSCYQLVNNASPLVVTLVKLDHLVNVVTVQGAFMTVKSQQPVAFHTSVLVLITQNKCPVTTVGSA